MTSVASKRREGSSQSGYELRKLFSFKVDGQLRPVNGELKTTIVWSIVFVDDAGIKRLQLQHGPLLGWRVLQGREQPECGGKSAGPTEQEAYVRIGASLVRVVRCVEPDASVRLNLGARGTVDHLSNRHSRILPISDPNDVHVAIVEVEGRTSGGAA